MASSAVHSSGTTEEFYFKMFFIHFELKGGGHVFKKIVSGSGTGVEAVALKQNSSIRFLVLLSAHFLCRLLSFLVRCKTLQKA